MAHHSTIDRRAGQAVAVPYKRRYDYHELGEHVTSLILKSLPPNLSISRLCAFLEKITPGKYDFIHLPHHEQTRHNIALAFINFVDHDSARTVYYMFLHRDSRPWRRTRATPGNIQGLENNLSYFLARFGVEGLKRPDAPLIFQVGQQVEISDQFLRECLTPANLACGLASATNTGQEGQRTVPTALVAALQPGFCLLEAGAHSDSTSSSQRCGSSLSVQLKERRRDGPSCEGSGDFPRERGREGDDFPQVPSYMHRGMRVFQL
ncbi:unnamed protein product [Durusdinium trenchii]|uniref:Mei2-like C-terminal RNA recognition motif domain-containing protein n=1 Tax=Durusdinium trenchii TaxID=1381693 RepID=A0ABP0MZN0_9DINO